MSAADPVPEPNRPRHRDDALPPRTRRILHLDIDAFLASVEQALHPELVGKPIVVGGMPTDRNLVMSSSYEARAFGVRSGMLLAEAARRCPHAIFRRGDAQAGNRLREDVIRILLDVSPRVEVASIDDFFVDLTGATRLFGSAFDVADTLRATIRHDVRLPVTIGIGTNKTLARLAGKFAKPGGIGEIWPGCEAAILNKLPVHHVPGAGHAIGRMLERFAIRTCGELALVTREIMFASFGMPGLVLHARALGIDRDPVETTHTLAVDGTLRARPPKSIRRDSTFEPEEGRRELIQSMLAYLVERAAHKLRSHACVTKTILVRIVYVDTRPAHARRIRPAGDDEAGQEGGGEFEKRRTLAHATDSTDELTRLALALLADLPRRRALVKRVGLTLTNLTTAHGWQHHLFDEPGVAEADDPSAHATEASTDDSRSSDRLPSNPAHSAGSRASHADRQRAIDAALDALRAKHGFGRVLRGASFLLAQDHELGPDGFRLRTPSLNQ